VTLFSEDPPTFEKQKSLAPTNVGASVNGNDTEVGATAQDIAATKKAIKDFIAARLAYDKLAKDE
jgi:hypothetical protein